MITKNMVIEGYNKGLIELIKSPNGDGIVCQIGDYWFYFGGETASMYDDIEEYKSVTLTSCIVNDIYETLEEFFNTGGEFEDEYLYYECYLRENGINGVTKEFTTRVKVMECCDHDVCYGILKIHNITVDKIQKKIYEIKNNEDFLEEYPDWTIDDVFNQFPDEWEWEFINTSTDDIVEI